MMKLKELCFGQDFLSMPQRRKIFWFVGVFLMIICLISIELYLDRTLESQTDSDVSSELILANQLAEEGSLLSSNWYYSTEIRVLNTNIVFAPLFRLFRNWHKIRLCGTIIIHLCIVLSAYFLCRITKTLLLFPFVGTMLILPFSGGYYSVVLQFPYYAPHIIITLLAFSMMVCFSESKSHKSIKVLTLFLEIVLSILAGMGGARQIIVCFLPLFLSVLFHFVRRNAKVTGESLGENGNKYLVVAIVCITGGLIGYYLNTNVLKEKYHFMVYDISFSGFDANRMFAALGGFLQSFGFISGKMEGRMFLHNSLAALLLLCSVFSAICGIKKGWKKSSSYYFYSSFYISSMVVFVLLYSSTNMSYVERYNLPIISLAAPMIAMGLLHLADYKRKFRSTILVLLSLLIVFSGYEYLDNKGISEEKRDHQLIADYLVSHGYYKGYATFWNANIMTELSNGAIDVYDWSDFLSQADGDVDRTFKWLQLVKHDTEHPEGKVFLLFHNDQIKPNMDPNQVASKKLWQLQDENIVFTQGNYTVYGYESYGDMICNIYDYNFVFQDGSWLINGEDDHGIRVLNEAGISYGPYVTFRPGRYRVTVFGSGLLHANYTCTYNCGANQIDIEIISQNDQEVVYEFLVAERVENGEVLIKNTSTEPVKVQSEQIDFLKFEK